MERDKNLEMAMTQIERQFGKGAIMKLGDEGAIRHVKAIPTGALSLDLALGIGGVPRGRIVEIYGPEASGKTTLSLHVVAAVAASVDTPVWLAAGLGRRLPAEYVDAIATEVVGHASAWDLDVDELPRQRSPHEHDPSVGVARHGVAARDEAVGSHVHRTSVGVRQS